MAIINIIDKTLFDETLYDKVYGMLAGVALGDALGHPHEFRYQTDNYTGKLIYRPKHMSQWQGTKYAVIGQYTDDTEQTLALAHSLVEKDEYNRDDVILSYEHWASVNTTGMGNNTRSLFKGVKTVKGYENRYRKAMCGELVKPSRKTGTDNTSSIITEIKSNGSLMRCSPLALLSDYNSVLEDVNLTNPNQTNQDCAIVYITALRFLLKGCNLQQVYDSVKKLPQTIEVKEVFDQIDSNISRDVLPMKGYVVHSFYCAMWTLHQLTTNYKSMIQTSSYIFDHIIRLGGDTDTNAAISGAIIGAGIGFKDMMSDRVTQDNYKIIETMNPDEGDCHVHERYLPHNILGLSNKLVKIYGKNF